MAVKVLIHSLNHWTQATDSWAYSLETMLLSDFLNLASTLHIFAYCQGEISMSIMWVDDI